MEHHFHHDDHEHEEREDEHLDRRILRKLHEIEVQLAALQATVDQLVPAQPGPPASGTISFQGDNMSDISVSAGFAPVPATVSYKDADGADTPPQSPPSWSSSDSTIAVVDSSADSTGLTASVSGGGAEGVATISAATTNDDGTVVTAVGTVTVGPGAPVSGEITFG
jgi:hypothetical protein